MPGLVWNRLRRHPASEDMLKCFVDAIDPPSLGHRRYLGVMPVELDRIVGSVGRCRDLDRSFSALHGPRERGRLRRVREALSRNDPLPAVELYKVAEEYFILDGHHRIAAAKELGQAFIDARVIEFQPPALYVMPSPPEAEAGPKSAAVPPRKRRSWREVVTCHLGRLRRRDRVARALECPLLLPTEDGVPGCGNPERMERYG